MRDNTGVKHTCPLIDEVIIFIDALCEDKETDPHHSEKTMMTNTMEKIRKANINLRDFGNEQFKRAEDLEEENERIKTVIERLREENKYLSERSEAA